MIRGFIAASADGYVADEDGGVDWLEPFNDVDFGYEQFSATLDAVVLGRKTFEQILSFDTGWPYRGKKGFVVSSFSLDVPFEGVAVWNDGIESLAAHLNEQALESWVVGGPTLQSAFIEEGLMERLELFVVPILLGKGIALHRSDKGFRHLRLDATQTYDKGMVKLDYGIVA